MKIDRFLLAFFSTVVVTVLAIGFLVVISDPSYGTMDVITVKDKMGEHMILSDTNNNYYIVMQDTRSLILYRNAQPSDKIVITKSRISDGIRIIEIME